MKESTFFFSLSHVENLVYSRSWTWLCVNECWNKMRMTYYCILAPTKWRQPPANVGRVYNWMADRVVSLELDSGLLWILKMYEKNSLILLNSVSMHNTIGVWSFHALARICNKPAFKGKWSRHRIFISLKNRIVMQFNNSDFDSIETKQHSRSIWV